jgi:hypothetical protein
MHPSSHETMQPPKKKIKSRPPATGTPVQVRLQAEQLAALDDWRREQPDLPGRAEALRRIFEASLKGKRGK